MVPLSYFHFSMSVLLLVINCHNSVRVFQMKRSIKLNLNNLDCACTKAHKDAVQ